jgi:hypothetical protein
MPDLDFLGIASVDRRCHDMAYATHDPDQSEAAFAPAWTGSSISLRLQVSPMYNPELDNIHKGPWLEIHRVSSTQSPN